jgi:hypothetical protein
LAGKPFDLRGHVQKGSHHPGDASGGHAPFAVHGPRSGTIPGCSVNPSAVKRTPLIVEPAWSRIARRKKLTNARIAE